jgi:ElaB/YqjD/DUF883 family membrane-anchored ribosome-binding protein
MHEWNSEEFLNLRHWITSRTRFDVRKVKPTEVPKHKAQDPRKSAIRRTQEAAEDVWEGTRGKTASSKASELKGRVRRTVADARDEVQGKLKGNTFRRIVQAVKDKLFGTNHRRGTDKAELLKEAAKDKGYAAARVFGTAQNKARNVGESIRHTASDAADMVGETGEVIQRKAGVARHKVGELYDQTVESLSDAGQTVQQSARDARKAAQRKALEAQDYAKKSVKETREFLLDKAALAREAVEQTLEKAHIISPKPVKKNLWQKIFG